jgi:transglutaminase-like putative cysteine protease
MPILTVRHVTTYHYKQPVAFGEHRMMLRPRDDDDQKVLDDDRVTGGNTHAWVQVYVPGPGWVDFDPSSGTVGNQNLVRVAIVRELREAIPLQGTWIVTESDHLTMKVAVKVITAARPTRCRDRSRNFL